MSVGIHEYTFVHLGLSRWYSSKKSCQCRRPKRHRFDPWVRKMPWSRKWQPTPAFSPGKFHGKRSLMGSQRVGRDWATEHAYMHMCTRLWVHTHTHTQKYGGFPGCSDDKNTCLQCGRPRFNPWLGKIPWRRKWLPTPVFLPGKFHGQRTLAGVHGVTKSQTRPSEFHYYHYI